MKIFFDTEFQEREYRTLELYGMSKSEAIAYLKRDIHELGQSIQVANGIIEADLLVDRPDSEPGDTYFDLRIGSFGVRRLHNRRRCGFLIEIEDGGQLPCTLRIGHDGRCSHWRHILVAVEGGGNKETKSFTLP